MTDVEKRLTDALAAHGQQVDIDPDAWQTHLELTRAHGGDGSRPPATTGRWRAPLLVAASVVAVGLIGGIAAQTALSGGDPVAPAGPVSPVATSTVPTDRSPTDPQQGPEPVQLPGAPGAGGPSSEHAPEHPSDPPSDRTSQRPSDRPSDRPTHTELADPTRGQAGAPASTEAGAPPPSAALVTSRPAGTTTTRAPELSTGQQPPGPSTDAVVLSTESASASSAVTATTSAATIDLRAQVPCGQTLPPLDKSVPGITVSGGPGGVLINAAKQPVSVLATGFAVMASDGSIASITGGDPALRKVTVPPLPRGRSSFESFPAIRPVGLCHTVDVAVTDSSAGASTVFQIGPEPGLPDGTYRATTVVLLGTDLAHAHAYRAGEVWNFSNG